MAYQDARTWPGSHPLLPPSLPPAPSLQLETHLPPFGQISDVVSSQERFFQPGPRCKTLAVGGPYVRPAEVVSGPAVVRWPLFTHSCSPSQSYRQNPHPYKYGFVLGYARYLFCCDQNSWSSKRRTEPSFFLHTNYKQQPHACTSYAEFRLDSPCRSRRGRAAESSLLQAPKDCFVR